MNELDDILDRFDQSRQTVEKQKEDRQHEQEARLDRAHAVILKHVLPPVQSAEVKLRTRGHDIEVRRGQEQVRMELTGFPGHPFLAFGVNGDELTVTGSRLSTSSQSGTRLIEREPIKTDKLSQEKVEKEVVEWIRAVLEGE